MGDRLERHALYLAVRRLLVVLAAVSIVLPPVAPALAQAPAAGAPSASDLARDGEIANVVIAPDGKHIAAIVSPTGEERYIGIWDAEDFSKKPVILNATRMRFQGLDFVKSDRLIVSAIQTFTIGSTRTHTSKQYITDLDGSKWTPVLAPPPNVGVGASSTAARVNSLSDSQIIDSLPRDPRNVLVLDERYGSEGDVYKVDIYSGRAVRVDRASDRFFAPQTDLNGEIRAKQTVDFDKGKVYFAQFLKNPDTGVMEEHFRWYAAERVPTEVVGFDVDPNIAFVRSAKGQDKVAIYEYDIRARKVLEPLFEHKLWPAAGLVRSTADADYGRILGFGYLAETSKIFWTDPAMKAAAESLDKALGEKTSRMAWVDPGTGLTSNISVLDGAQVAIVDWSRDRQTIVAMKAGPKQPPEYYVLRGGKVSLLGRSRPWIDTSKLGDTTLVEYPARDGLMIPGFLTLPPKDRFGPGPYPTLIEPHGGPWGRDYMNWDVTGWTQYFASKGYAVLQPQFRGSDDWGQKLWRAGDGEWGQKMQDDKDDGAKWLISKGIAAPERIAMFGYSYGGYAALAAAIRPNGLYQCAISGAGAGDLASIQKATSDNRFLREFQRPTIDGLDALDHAAEAKIPLFIYHGDRDQVVELRQSEAFVAKLKAAGKPYRYLEIKDMGHTINTWGVRDGELQLTEVEKYLATDCGPGGI